MRLVQLSDPHIVAFNQRLVRGCNPLLNLQHAIQQAITHSPDLIVISGDLCHDETWAGYVCIRNQLQRLPGSLECALLPGNHDNPLFLQSVFGREALIAPADINIGGIRLILLNSHLSGQVAGQLGPSQLRWLEMCLLDTDKSRLPLVVALHHPPVEIGSSWLDELALLDGQQLLELLRPVQELRAVLFGHIHQHWRGLFPARPDVPLLGCPSTLCSFTAVQSCPFGREDDPGGRLIEIDQNGNFHEMLLRWSDSGAD